MRACNKKLKSSLKEAMKLDNARLEWEMKGSEPHVFSDDFEKRMEEVMKVETRKKRTPRFFRFAAIALMIAVLSGGVILAGSDELRASVVSIDILNWLEKFFTVEEGVDERREEDVLFDESRLGYVPEGFEKVEEFESFTNVWYKYKNELGEYFSIQVVSDKNVLNVDNEKSQSEVKVNTAGFEYTITYKNDDNSVVIMWKNQADVYYMLAGIMKKEELIKIMDAISY